MGTKSLQGKYPGIQAHHEINLVPRHRVDAMKWDACIRHSKNESPLAYSWVLDLLSPGWEGLIIGDYAGVMPLPTSKRLGFRMLQMPPEVLTLGIFSNSPEIIQMFPFILYHPLFSKFRFISYNGSPFHGENPVLRGITTKYTFELYLNKSYSDLFQAYSRNHRRSIRAFFDRGFEIITDNNPGAFTSLVAELGKKRPELFMPAEYLSRFESMTAMALNKTPSTTSSVWFHGKLIGASFFLSGATRIIPFHAANEEGRVYKTSFALIDNFIKKNAGKEKILDFAGSVLPNVASFNRRFGAVATPYSSATINRLPLPVRMAKEANLLFRVKKYF